MLFDLDSPPGRRFAGIKKRGGPALFGIRFLSGKTPPDLAAGISRENAHRVAWYVEMALLALTGAGIAILMLFWVQAETLLPPGESPVLARARLMRGIFSLAVPLAPLLFLSTLRIRIAMLLKRQNANPATMQSAKYVWLLIIALIIIILTIDAFVIGNSFQDFDFN